MKRTISEENDEQENYHFQMNLIWKLLHWYYVHIGACNIIVE